MDHHNEEGWEACSVIPATAITSYTTVSEFEKRMCAWGKSSRKIFLKEAIFAERKGAILYTTWSIQYNSCAKISRLIPSLATVWSPLFSYSFFTIQLHSSPFVKPLLPPSLTQECPFLMCLWVSL
jgi:hypothetical protein